MKWCWVTFNFMGGTEVTKITGTDGLEYPGSSDSNYSIRIERGKKLDDMPTAKKDGYIFLGWYTSPIGGVYVTAGNAIEDDTILFAQWQIDYNTLLTNIDGDIAAAIDEIEIPEPGGGEGGEDAEQPDPLAPLWMSEDGYSTWTNADGTTGDTTFPRDTALSEADRNSKTVSYWEERNYGADETQRART